MRSAPLSVAPPEQFNEEIEAVVASRCDLRISRYRLEYRNGVFDLLRIASARRDSGEPVLMLRAGVHGDEVSGPISIARHLDEIAEYAHARRVQLVVYPLANPSGYARGLRYNIDHDRGEEGNNDFLRYELHDGRMTGAITNEMPYRRFYWSSDPTLGVSLPLETQLMHRLLREEPLERIRGVLDLHQDYLTAGAPPAAYHYAFGRLDDYDDIISRIRSCCPLLGGCAIGAGFGTRIDADGRVIGEPDAGAAATSDDNGFIVRHDGTFTDLLYRLGARHAIAPETTGATPLDLAVAVNLIWIRGLIDLIGGPRA